MSTHDSVISAPIRLRALEPDDADLLYVADNDCDVWPGSESVAPYSQHMLREYALNYDADPFSAGQIRLVATIAEGRHESSPIGLLDLYEISPLHAHAWVGIYVRPEMRRRGYALEMLRLAAVYASSTLRINRLGARVLDSNEASMKLFSRAGYRHCGMLPQWHFSRGGFEDMHIFCIDLH
ncbi:MAG: GNAT family N-acetyltransferase [Muribaculaceae bacterium]|nr:GNAT family N-acetyltransferase [Muribaculaceae bacterium]MDE7080168.1 GNAT family N-acetyltransferase [Muribaculaceae bacterium]